jgi:hypothetical protein
MKAHPTTPVRPLVAGQARGRAARIIFAAVMVLFCLGLVCSQAQPANDRFANRILLTGSNVVTTGSNVGATKEVGETNHVGLAGGASVWWKWTAPCSTNVTLSTAGSSFDTLLAVYTGPAIVALTPVASNNDDPSATDHTSTVIFKAISNQTYQIAVDGMGGATGWVQLLLTAQALNDRFANRLRLTGSNVVAIGSNAGATREVGEPDHAGIGSRASLWWEWTAPFSECFTISIAVSNSDTLLGVYTGSSVSALTEVARNDYYGGATNVTFSAISNQTYQIAVDTRYVTGSVRLQLQVAGPTQPVNDFFARRLVLTGTNLVATGSNVGATSEVGEPFGSDDPYYATGASVWWQWTAPSSDSFTISTAGSSFDTLLGVYTGSAVTALTEVASNDDDPAATDGTSKVTFSANANQTYQIAVDGYYDPSATGSVRLALSLSSQAQPVNDRFANRIRLTGSNVVANGSTVGADREPGEPKHAGQQGGASVWWEWTAPSSDSFTFSTAGSSFDTLLAVYTGSSVTALTEVVSNDEDPAAGSTSALTFSANANQTYQIAVEGYQGDSGSVQLQIGLCGQAQPVNDRFANRIVLTGTNVVATGTTVGATREPGEPTLAAVMRYAYNIYSYVSVWWEWTAPCTDNFTISTVGSNFPLALAVYTGSSVSALTEVAAAVYDPGAGVNTTRVVVNAISNQTYQIAVDVTQEHPDDTGSVQLLIQQGQPELVAWGVRDSYRNNSLGQVTLYPAYAPAGLSNVVAIATGERYSLALTAEGNVVAWGTLNVSDTPWGLIAYPAYVPDGLSNVVAIAAGGSHCLALTAGGRVVAWCPVSAIVNQTATNVPAGLNNVVAIAAGTVDYYSAYYLNPGRSTSLALTAAGRVVAWGEGGGTNVPAGLSNVVAIAAGGSHCLALTAAGRVVGWGDNSYGQTDVPAGLSNVVAIAAGGKHSLALTSEGRVVAWGDNYYGQTDVPAGLTNAVAIATGGDYRYSDSSYSLALTSEGRVVGWGGNYYGQTNVPKWLNGAVAIAAGGGSSSGHCLALTRQPAAPTPRLELSQGRFGLELRAQAAPGISCQLLRGSGLSGPWLPTQPVTCTNNVQLLCRPETTPPVQFFRLLRK